MSNFGPQSGIGYMYSGESVSPTGNGLVYPIESDPSTSGVATETRQNVQIKILPMPIPIGIPVQVYIDGSCAVVV